VNRDAGLPHPQVAGQAAVRRRSPVAPTARRRPPVAASARRHPTGTVHPPEQERGPQAP